MASAGIAIMIVFRQIRVLSPHVSNLGIPVASFDISPPPPPPDLHTITWEQASAASVRGFIGRIRSAPDAWKVYDSDRSKFKVKAPLTADIIVRADCSPLREQYGICRDMMFYMPGYQDHDSRQNTLAVIHPNSFDDNWLTIGVARKEYGESADEWVKRHVKIGKAATVSSRDVRIGVYRAVETHIGGGAEGIKVSYAPFPDVASQHIYESNRDDMTFIVIDGGDRFGVAQMRVPKITREDFFEFYRFIISTFEFKE